MATSAQQQQFVANWLPYATQAGDALGVAPSSVLSQWALESGWGTNSQAANFNVAGLEPNLSFTDQQAFEQAYVGTIQNNFPGAVNAGTNLSQFVQGLASGTKGSYFGIPADSYFNSLGGVLGNIQTLGVNPTVPPAVGTPGGATASGGSLGGASAAAPGAAAGGACGVFSGFFTWTCWQNVITDLAFVALGVMVFVVAVGSGVFGTRAAKRT